MNPSHHYTGLTPAQVQQSRQQYGENILTPPKKESLWRQFLRKFADPIIIILLVALLLSAAVACFEYATDKADIEAFFEPVGILIAVLLATTVGFFFEVSANRKFDVLNQVNDELPVDVLREGGITQISKREVVVGDIVVLNTGDEVSADGELIEAISLQLNESTLTGEPVAKKTTDPANFDEHATYPLSLIHI